MLRHGLLMDPSGGRWDHEPILHLAARHSSELVKMLLALPPASGISADTLNSRGEPAVIDALYADTHGLVSDLCAHMNDTRLDARYTFRKRGRTMRGGTLLHAIALLPTDLWDHYQRSSDGRDADRAVELINVAISRPELNLLALDDDQYNACHRLHFRVSRMLVDRPHGDGGACAACQSWKSAFWQLRMATLAARDVYDAGLNRALAFALPSHCFPLPVLTLVDNYLRAASVVPSV
jgi:hypothetical protein